VSERVEKEVEMFDGCGYQGCEFGASYPDSVCLAGWLFDADSGYSIPGGWAYTHGGDIPCPNCNADEHLPQIRLAGEERTK
jgi:hypothetical protein